MTQHNLCDACETVAHCMKHGCIPITREDRRVRPVDWPTLVRDLEACGMTSRRIGELVGTSHSAVLGWKNLGKEPGHFSGESLIALWCETTGNARAAARMESPVSSETRTLVSHAENHVERCDSSPPGDGSDRG